VSRCRHDYRIESNSTDERGHVPRRKTNLGAASNLPTNAFQLACVWKNPALKNRQAKSISLALASRRHCSGSNMEARNKNECSRKRPNGHARRRGGVCVATSNAPASFHPPSETRHALPFTGLSRTQIYLMCKSGKVKSHSLKRRGTCRGVRLIDFQSLVAAIQEFASAEQQENQKK
jgi:hypothetical protein